MTLKQQPKKWALAEGTHRECGAKAALTCRTHLKTFIDRLLQLTGQLHQH